MTGEEQQSAAGIGLQLADLHRHAGEFARADHRRRTAAGDGLRTGVDHQRVAGRDLGIAPRQHRGRGFGNIHRDLPLVPGGLAVDDVHIPLDIGGICGQFADHVAGGVVAIDAELCGFAFQRTGGVAVETQRLRRRVGDLWADVELPLAVADAGEADGRMDRGTHDPSVHRLRIRHPGRVLRRAWHHRLRQRHAVDVAAIFRRSAIHHPARIGDAAGRPVIGQGMPRVVRQALGVGGLAARIQVLLRQFEDAHLHRRTGLFAPAHGGGVQRHVVVVGLELQKEAEARRSLAHARVQIGAQIERIVEVGRRSPRSRIQRFEFVLHEAVLAERRGQDAPVIGGQHRFDHFLHVIEDARGDRVVLQIFVALAVQRLAGEFAHVLRGVDEEHIVVLQDEVVGDRVLIGLEQLFAVDAEEFDADAGGAFQIGPSRLDIRREAHPRRIFLRLGEHADAQVLGQRRVDDEAPLRGAVQAQEHRPRRRIAAGGHAAALEVIDEQLSQTRDRIAVAAARTGRQDGR